jgi:hypothetical protein
MWRCVSICGFSETIRLSIYGIFMLVSIFHDAPEWRRRKKILLLFDFLFDSS